MTLNQNCLLKFKTSRLGNRNAAVYKHREAAKRAFKLRCLLFWDMKPRQWVILDAVSCSSRKFRTFNFKSKRFLETSHLITQC